MLTMRHGLSLSSIPLCNKDALLITSLTSESIQDIQADAIVVGLSGNALTGFAAELNEATSGPAILADAGQPNQKLAAQRHLQPTGIQAP